MHPPAFIRHLLELATTRVRGSHNEYAWSFGTEVPLPLSAMPCRMLAERQ